MAQKVVALLIISLIATNCATFRHNTIPIQEQLTTILEGLSKIADKAFIGAQRQAFAKQVMVPATEAALGINDCLLNNNCKNLADNLTNLSQALLVGVNVFVSLVPQGELRDSLLGRLNSALAFVNNIRAKHEAEDSEAPISLYQTEVFLRG